MFKSALWIGSVLLLAMVIGPISVVASQSNQTDKADIYIVFEFGSSAGFTEQMASFGAQEISPVRAPLARIVHASPTTRTQLQTAGYTMIPASALAALCGIDRQLPRQHPRI